MFFKFYLCMFTYTFMSADVIPLSRCYLGVFPALISMPSSTSTKSIILIRIVWLVNASSSKSPFEKYGVRPAKQRCNIKFLWKPPQISPITLYLFQYLGSNILKQSPEFQMFYAVQLVWDVMGRSWRLRLRKSSYLRFDTSKLKYLVRS